ncbi:uncharacterized protein [Panulirus ornatus]|uniref:uncharacterized protein isoform X3 n=1 Tax=Panulirus ornatus TaxID=150431 RepID=UPI003A8C674F
MASRRSLGQRSSLHGGTAASSATMTHDPYSEIELYLRKAEEEISAVFGEVEVRSESREDVPRPRTPARPPLLDGQASPSKIRKVYSGVRQTESSSSPPRRQTGTSPSHPRRRVPFIRRPRRVSAPALTNIHSYNGTCTPPPWQPRADPHLQEWSKGLLKDFHSLVEEEIRSLHRHTQPSHTSNGALEFGVHNFPSGGSSPGQRGEPGEVVRRKEPPDEDGGGTHEPVRQASTPQDATDGMGATQSAGRGDAWVGEKPGNFKTYTLPRAGGHRSISLSGTGGITYRASAAHPDDTDVSCQLLRVNPRFSRSHSLDEGAGLSPWALHHLSVIDGAHVKLPTPTDASSSASMSTVCTAHQSEPRDIPSTPHSARDAGPYSMPEGHYGKIRKTGITEKDNEQWRPTLGEGPQVNGGGGGVANGWPEHAGEAARALCDATNSTDSAKLHRASEPYLNNNGSSAFTAADLEKGVSESWAWADQEDACSLTDRPCDPDACPHCRAKRDSSMVDEERRSEDVDNQKEMEVVELAEEATSIEAGVDGQPGEGVSVLITPPEAMDVCHSEEVTDEIYPEEAMERQMCSRECCGRKSEPALLSLVTGPLDGRRHTLPAPRVYGSLSLLSAPAPTFSTSSWETLPPADELEVELEEKPISASVARPMSPAALSATSSRSLNSSLSSLSHLSVHPDHSECDSWPSSPVTQQYLSPEVFFDPVAMVAPQTGDYFAVKKPLDREDDIFFMEKTETTDGFMESCSKGQEGQAQKAKDTPSPEPITGVLQLRPVGSQGTGDIIFSVSIPENRKKEKHKTEPSLDLNGSSDANTVCDKLEVFRNDAKDGDMARSETEETMNGSSDLMCLRLDKLNMNEDGMKEDDPRPKRPMLGRSDTKDSGVTDLSSSVEGPTTTTTTTAAAASCSSSAQQQEDARNRSVGDLRKPPARYRSFSLDETSTAPDNPNIKLVNSSTQSHRPEALDDFLRAVESRIRRGSLDQSPQDLPPPSIFHPSPLSTPASTPLSTATQDLSVTPTVVLDACTQTTPMPTPPPASRASSDTWLSECGCDDQVSMEPCVSSLALSATEDDYGEDDDDDDWSAGASLSSSSPPPTPASMPRDDSSLSLSESLDTLDLNGESGIGTVSTRPSVSPHPHVTLDLSGSNLSSEDTGLENSFERQIRRYIPHNRSGRETEHGLHYRRRRPRPRQQEQWVRREDQTTQTDPEPPQFSLSIEEDSHDSFRESNETLEQGRGRSEGQLVRHTHSEPRLDAPTTPMAGVLRGVCSEVTLPPLPLPRASFTPSAPALPTLTEDKPPKAPCKPSRPRHLPLVSPHQQGTPGKACSAPTLETRSPPSHTAHTPATTPSEDSSGETPALTTRAQSSKEIAELEALEACKWLRAAGFPQYAQMYEQLQFPLDLVCVERDHSFLDADSLQALFRRLRALNRCAKIRLDSARKNKAEESDDEEQQCALSGNWKFQRHSRRWSRIVHERSPSTGGEGKVCGESRGLELPDDALLGQFKRSGSERLKDGAKAILRRMESLKNKKKKRQNRDGVVISSPKLVDEAHMEARVAELVCVDISPDGSPELSSRGTTTREVRQSTPGETSTPLFRGRRRRRFWRREGSSHGGGEGGGGAYSDSECSPPTWRHYLTDANSNKMAPVGQTPSLSPEKRTNKAGTGRQSRAGQLRHTGSLTYGKDSQIARDNFLASIRGSVEKSSENISPLPSPDEERHSVYDNVPLIICNKSYHDYQPEVMDSEASAHEGSGSSECTVESRDSPLPSTHDDDENYEPCQRRATVDRWHSFNRKSYPPSTRQLGTQINGFSAGQMLHLRKRALLRLTALMERYCPSNRSGWNWELPKFMRKMKTPDYRDRQVFGVPLLVITQRTGQPLPPGIQAALQYLRATSLDQVGIFRKPGVRSRIQKLREFHESGDDIQYSAFGTCDIADMVKTYFRELPEVLLTNKLSEMFIAIFQYLPAEHRLEALQCAVLLLPDENREVLMALLTFLADVAANSHLNQMNASNLAVCLAPSLFHLNVGGSGSSPLRRRAGGTPEQRDLHENKAAHQCLTLMIQQVSQIQCVPLEMLANCRFTYLEQSQPVCLEDLGVIGSPGSGTMDGDWASYMNACITSLLKEARDKSRGWVHMNCADSHVEILYRKVGDGHPLRLWRATTEVEAPPSELLNRVIRERHLWDDSLLKWRVVNRLDREAEVFQYMCNSMPPRPPVDYCVLRCWRSNLARGSCVVVETSVEHGDAPVLVGGVRGIVLASRYLIQPCGSGKSRITHISRLDMRGRTPEWYNKVYGHSTAIHLTRIRESFQHHAVGPESKV